MIHRAVNQSTGIPFSVRIVLQGENYGLNNCLTHDREDPLVEFFDARFSSDLDESGDQVGQFVTRYNLSTLEGRDGFSKPIWGAGGLNLDGGIPNWSVDQDFMSGLQAFLKDEGLIEEAEDQAPGL